MSDVIEVVLITAASLIGLALFVAAGLYAMHRFDEWDNRKRDALDREQCDACQSDLPLTCLTIADPRDLCDSHNNLCDSHNNLCDSHNKRYRSISKLEYDTDMWKRGQA